MNYRRFREALPRLLHTDEGDSEFHVFRTLFTGLASARLGKVLNYVCRCIDRNEMYVEIGSYTGFTLISAGYRNTAPVVGIENFSSPFLYETTDTGREVIRKMLYENVDKFGRGNESVVEKDFRQVDFKGGTVAVLFVDGEHDYKNVDDAFNWIEPSLSTNAIVICDDVCIEGVYKRVIEAAASGLYELLYLSVYTSPKQDEDQHKGKITDVNIGNGIAVLQRKNALGGQ